MPPDATDCRRRMEPVTPERRGAWLVALQVPIEASVLRSELQEPQ
jgi:hypothetical protein